MSLFQGKTPYEERHVLWYTVSNNLGKKPFLEKFHWHKVIGRAGRNNTNHLAPHVLGGWTLDHIPSEPLRLCSELEEGPLILFMTLMVFKAFVSALSSHVRERELHKRNNSSFQWVMRAFEMLFTKHLLRLCWPFRKLQDLPSAHVEWSASVKGDNGGSFVCFSLCVS